MRVPDPNRRIPRAFVPSSDSPEKQNKVHDPIPIRSPPRFAYVHAQNEFFSRLLGRSSRQAERLLCAEDIGPVAQMMELPRLQRLDFHLAEFHHALVVRDALVVLEPQAMLKRDPTARKLGILRAVDRFLPVERHGEFRARGGDLIDVPFGRTPGANTRKR